MTRREEVRLAHAGTTLFALDQGSGPPLVFFHGGLADHRAALVQVGSLTDRLRVITPDARAAGRSTWAGPLDWQLFADDTRALLRHLGLARAVIGGVSSGSSVAVRTALSHPDVVTGLVIVHPVHPGADRGMSEATRAAMEAMDAVGRRAPTEGTAVLHPLLDALPEPVRARAIPMLDSFDPASVATTTAFLASGAQPFATASELAAIRCPTLLVPGVDATHPIEVATLLAEHLPDVTVDRSGDLAEAIVRLCAAVLS